MVTEAQRKSIRMLSDEAKWKMILSNQSRIEQQMVGAAHSAAPSGGRNLTSRSTPMVQRRNVTQTSTRGDVKNKATPDYFAHKLQTKEAQVKHLTTLRVMLKSREIGCGGGAGPALAIGMPCTDARGGVVDTAPRGVAAPGGSTTLWRSAVSASCWT